MKICTTCGADNAAELDMCEQCGTPLFASAVVVEDPEPLDDGQGGFGPEASVDLSEDGALSSGDEASDDPSPETHHAPLADPPVFAARPYDEDQGGLESLRRAQALRLGGSPERRSAQDEAEVDRTEAAILEDEDYASLDADGDELEAPQADPDFEEGYDEDEEDALPLAPSRPPINEEDLPSVEVVPIPKPQFEDPLADAGMEYLEEAAPSMDPESVVASLIDETIGEDSIVKRLPAAEPVSIDVEKPEKPNIVKRPVEKKGPPVAAIVAVILIVLAAAGAGIAFFLTQ